MAEIGLLHPVFAPISAETANSAITYGTGIVVAKAVSADVTWNRSNNPFYADDAVAENDNSIIGGSIKFGIDHLALSVANTMLGETKATVSSIDEYTETDAIAPAGGFGYIRVLRKNGVTSYRAYWVHKTRFGVASETAKTKGQSIAWENPTIEGDVIGVHIDSSGNAQYRTKADFSTYAAAESWLHGKANITAA